jgi:heptosyltransferase III
VKEHTFENVLVVRTDRIGDVVLALPMISVLRASFPRATISMLLRSYTQELVEGFDGLDHILAYDDSGEQKGFLSILGEVRSKRFDLVVVSHPTFRIAVLMFLAGIHLRVGSGYRWYSFLFNRKVFEHRKTAEKHEAEYNVSLLSVIGCEADKVPHVVLPIPEKARDTAAKEMKRIAISHDHKIVVIHPGSGGSARDWSAGNFAELAKDLKIKGYQVVVTGSATERSLADSVVDRSGGSAVSVAGRLSLKELAAFLASAQLYISNSTGPLHIAAAVGIPVIAFYPPIRECSARRWGPLTDKKKVFTADSTICPRCKGGPCQGNDCMDQIRVADVVQAARTLLESEDTSKRP